MRQPFAWAKLKAAFNLQRDFQRDVGSIPAITGVGASAFVFSTAASGIESFTGPGASTFVFTDGATGKETFTGTDASTFSFGTSGVGIVLVAITGSSASAFSFRTDGLGDTPIVVKWSGEFRPRLRSWNEPRVDLHLPEPIAGAADSGFGFSASGSARHAPPIRGTSEVAFAWTTYTFGEYTPLEIKAVGDGRFEFVVSSVGDQDEGIAFEDARLLGLADEELIGV